VRHTKFKKIIRQLQCTWLASDWFGDTFWTVMASGTLETSWAAIRYFDFCWTIEPGGACAGRPGSVGTLAILATLTRQTIIPRFATGTFSERPGGAR